MVHGSSNMHVMHVVGKELVVWNDGQQWRCFEDLCPHRKVPLSEGRVEAGKLECAYHGWKFDNIGKPVSIPQVGLHNHAAGKLQHTWSHNRCAFACPSSFIGDSKYDTCLKSKV